MGVIQKITFKPGVNRENTRFFNEGGWYESDKIRFRQGSPEKIGGWTQYSRSTFLGVCRLLWNWITLTSQNIVAVGTNLKFYLTIGDQYYDITPIRLVQTLTNPFTATASSSTITVTASNHGAIVNDFVTFSGATGLGGNITAGVLNQTYQVTSVTSVNTFKTDNKEDHKKIFDLIETINLKKADKEVVDQIRADIRKVVWIILGAVIVAVLALVIKK